MSERLSGVDRLRGLVIVLMALDHMRGFVAPFSPEDFSRTTLAFFLVRWVTHFCAPVFLLLAGVGANLHSQRGDRAATARFLFTRGLWLMLLELTWVNFSWFFSFDSLHLGVLWAIGGAMVVLSALVRLPRRWVGLAGLLMILVLEFTVLEPDNPVMGLLFEPSSWELGGLSVQVVYVIVPWWAVMALGWGFGDLIRDRRRVLVGLGMTLAFLGLRAWNGLDQPWEVYPETGRTVAHFLNPSKYPPSLLFLLMTLGPALMVLGLLERLPRSPLDVFGRVPLFFYLIHLPFIHVAGMAWNRLRHGQTSASGTELELWAIVGLWVLASALLYPICVRWAALKRKHPDRWWLRYL